MSCGDYNLTKYSVSHPLDKFMWLIFLKGINYVRNLDPNRSGEQIYFEWSKITGGIARASMKNTSSDFGISMSVIEGFEEGKL